MSACNENSFSKQNVDIAKIKIDHAFDICLKGNNL